MENDGDVTIDFTIMNNKAFIYRCNTFNVSGIDKADTIL